MELASQFEGWWPSVVWSGEEEGGGRSEKRVLQVYVSVVSWVVTGEESVFDVRSDPVALVSWDNEEECKTEPAFF